MTHPVIFTEFLCNKLDTTKERDAVSAWAGWIILEYCHNWTPQIQRFFGQQIRHPEGKCAYPNKYDSLVFGGFALQKSFTIMVQQDVGKKYHRSGKTTRISIYD